MRSWRDVESSRIGATGTKIDDRRDDATGR
jgi:hypothetical protein